MSSGHHADALYCRLFLACLTAIVLAAVLQVKTQLEPLQSTWLNTVREEMLPSDYSIGQLHHLHHPTQPWS